MNQKFKNILTTGVKSIVHRFIIGLILFLTSCNIFDGKNIKNDTAPSENAYVARIFILTEDWQEEFYSQITLTSKSPGFDTTFSFICYKADYEKGLYFTYPKKFPNWVGNLKFFDSYARMIGYMEFQYSGPGDINLSNFNIFNAMPKAVIEMTDSIFHVDDTLHLLGSDSFDSIG